MGILPERQVKLGLPQEQSEAHIAGLADNRLLSGGFPVSGMNWPAGRVNTALNAQPPSVTEGTAVLLDKVPNS